VGDVADLLRRHAQDEPRILLFDLERLPGEYTADIWEPRDLQRINYLHPDRWTRRPSTLCGSWLWYGDKRPGFAAAWESDDPHFVARRFAELIDTADVVVTYNGRKADLKWLRTDWLAADIPPPHARDIDLYAVARTAFSLESKSLRYLCDFLGVPTKAGHYDAAQAKAAAAGDEKAQRALRRYSVQDSVILAGVLDRLRPYITGINLGVFYADERDRCPSCGGDTLTPAGRVSTATGLYAAHRCTGCGTVARSPRRTSTTGLRRC